MREYILEKGGADFKKVYVKLGYYWIRPADKVTLYCSKDGYFAGHYYSSLAIFQRIPKLNSVVFVDFGCGPATSGLAFIDAMNPSDMNYIGIDIVKAMLYQAERFLGVYGVKNKTFLQNMSELDIPLNFYNDKIVVLNFSFLLNNGMFNQMDELLDILENMVKKIDVDKIYFIYQNPKNGEHKNWLLLQDSMRKYNIVSQVLNKELSYNNKQQEKIFTTYYDILSKK